MFAGTSKLRCLVWLATLLPFVVPGVAAQEPGKPRVIVLAFDGVDHGLSAQFIAEGHLPNLKALSENGTFCRLETTNPAESAVSWSSFGRGLNPGNTNMHGFVGRKPGTYMPEPRFMKLGDAAFEKFYDAEDAAGKGQATPWGPALWGVGGLLIGLVLGRVFVGSGPGAIVLALVAGGAGVGINLTLMSDASPTTSSTPTRVPTLESVVEGKPVWTRLDDAGVRVKGFLVPMSTPLEPLEHGQMVGGLGVPDVMGKGMGKYFIFSTSTKDVPSGKSRSTQSAGMVIRLFEDGGAFKADLPGPKNTVRAEAVGARLKDIDGLVNRVDIGDSERTALENERESLKDERAGKFETSLPVTVKRSGSSVEVSIGDQSAVVAEGEWSELLPVHFPVDWPLNSAALARFRVIQAGDEIRLFFTPLGYDPRDIPQHMQIEQPHGFSKKIAEETGLYDTTGWACATNPLKDVEIDEAVFLEQIKQLTVDRSRIVFHELGKDDYDFFFAMFGETDRVQHLMYRLIDEKNPMYDAETAAKHGSAILDMYKVMDDIVGQTMERFVDERTCLMVVSDHGFTSFRRQMAINTWLMQEGYLVPKGTKKSPTEMMRTLSSFGQDFLQYMDTSKSRAFALGLGKIYINVKGREKYGIVEDAEYDALCDEITQKLLALEDPETGDSVVRRVWRNNEVYQGPYAESDADLFLGFEKYYRVSWSTTTGGFSAEVIEDNDSNWSGDHASNDPEVVPGILFSNRKIDPVLKPAIIDMAPTILGVFDLASDGMDGRRLEVGGN